MGLFFEGGAIMNNTVVNIHIQVLCGHVSFLLGRHWVETGIAESHG